MRTHGYGPTNGRCVLKAVYHLIDTQCKRATASAKSKSIDTNFHANKSICGMKPEANNMNNLLIVLPSRRVCEIHQEYVLWIIVPHTDTTDSDSIHYPFICIYLLTVNCICALSIVRILLRFFVRRKSPESTFIRLIFDYFRPMDAEHHWSSGVDLRSITSCIWSSEIERKRELFRIIEQSPVSESHFRISLATWCSIFEDHSYFPELWIVLDSSDDANCLSDG